MQADLIKELLNELGEWSKEAKKVEKDLNNGGPHWARLATNLEQSRKRVLALSYKLMDETQPIQVAG